MILNISIKNFRSFKDEIVFSMVAESSKSKENNIFMQSLAQGESSVRLNNSALLFGANASGKSNLFNALFSIVKFITKTKTEAGKPIQLYQPFLFEENSKTQPVEFSIEFVNTDNIKYRYELTIDKMIVLAEKLYYWPKNKITLLFERVIPENSDALTHIGKPGQSLDFQPIPVFNNQAVLSKFGQDIPNETLTSVYIYFSNISIINISNYNMFSVFTSEITELLSKNKILLNRMNALLTHADTGIKAIMIEEKDEDSFVFPDEIDKGIKLWLRNKYSYKTVAIHNKYIGQEAAGEGELPFSEESSGTKQLFTIGGAILDALDKGKPILIDEMDIYLHTNISKMLITLFQNKRINKKNAQLIVATHDVNLLDRTLFRKDQIWFTEKDEYGVSSLYTLQDFTDVREDTPFDKWYMAGKFGAVPVIKSLENLFDEEE
jgi:AAA15 family ATPase/GTPase